MAGTLLPLVLLSAFLTVAGYQDAKRDAAERVLQTTRSTMATVDRELQNEIAGLAGLALSPALQTGDIEAFRGEAERYLARFPSSSGLGLSDATGQQLFNTNQRPGEPLPRRRNLAAVEAVFAKKTPYVSDVFIGSITNRPIITVDVPVMRNGEVVYDLYFFPPREIFADLLKQQSLPSGWVVAIFDRQAHHVSRIPALSDSELTSASESLQAEMAKSEEAIAATLSVEGTTLLTAFVRSRESGWAVAIGIPEETLSGAARQTIIVTITVGIGLILIGFGFAQRMAGQLARSEAARDLLIHELNHRVKNTLSAVQSIVNRTLRNAAAPPAAREAVDARILALSHAHNILSRRMWEAAELREIVQSVLAPYATNESGRVRLDGPDVHLTPRVAIALAMVLNELATNAAKYGAFSTQAGSVSLQWSMPDDNTLKMTWRESAGPAVTPPARTGYGSQFIERCITGELRGRLHMRYLPAGLECAMDIRL